MQRFSLPSANIEYVFDLDDTLYRERDYSRSALTFAGNLIASLFGCHNARDELLAFLTQGVALPLDRYWDKAQLPNAAKAQIVAAMNAHMPDIALYPAAKDVLTRLRRTNVGFSIVTDGRSITQRAKLHALNCLDAKYISISDEVNLPKTDVRRFLDFSAKFPANRYVYVGDNPFKDFWAPNKLGWDTIMVLNSGENVHQQHNVSMEFVAKRSINSLDELD